MVHLNRDFNQYSLNDWWQWQKLQENLNIPENWLRINDNLDVWFNMLLIANEYNYINDDKQNNVQNNAEYVNQIAIACLKHKKWSLAECFSSLSYWNQYKDILSNTNLFEKLIPIFANKNVDFLSYNNNWFIIWI